MLFCLINPLELEILSAEVVARREILGDRKSVV